MKKHIASVHEDNKNHVCGECGYTTSEKETLKKYVEGVHKKVKHVCEECGYAASRKDKLKIHIKGVHEKIRNHVCEKCGMPPCTKVN